jgi:hypothetical protein
MTSLEFVGGFIYWGLFVVGSGLVVYLKVKGPSDGSV